MNSNIMKDNFTDNTFLAICAYLTFYNGFHLLQCRVTKHCNTYLSFCLTQLPERLLFLWKNCCNI